MRPIGTVRTGGGEVPRHWVFSDKEGTLEIDAEYAEGLRDIRPGQRIVVLFHFHQSPAFTPELLTQRPPHREGPLGVFSICSPIRPNPIGLSTLEVLEVRGGNLRVKGVDMLDGTPILDIKPFIVDRQSCPSYEGPRSPGKP